MPNPRRGDVLFTVISSNGSPCICSADVAHRMFQTNLFGHLEMTRAILPFFRKQGSGCITFTSSNQIWGNLPYTSLYNMTKSATSSFAECLHKEVSSLGIRCVAFECGGAATRFFEPREKDQAAGHNTASGPSEAYVPGVTAISNTLVEWGMPPGDPAKMATAMVNVVRDEGNAKGRTWSSRIALGSDAVRWARLKARHESLVLDRWETISVQTDRDGAVLSEALDPYVWMPGAL